MNEYDIRFAGRGMPGMPLGFVYYIGCSETLRLKIGYTAKDVSKRLKNLQTGSAGELKVIAWQPGTMADEAALHTHFAAQRLHGEWFEMNEEIFDHLCYVVWNMAEMVVRLGVEKPFWLPRSLEMLEDHVGIDLPAHIKALR